MDLHEGCGRIKLFWLMALADSKTLKAMVEFREGKMFGFILIMILDGSWRYEQIIEF